MRNSPFPLLRMLQILTNIDGISKTELASKANIQYSRLVKSLTWLEAKGLLEHIVTDGRAKVRLTTKGKFVAAQLSSLFELDNVA